MQGDAVSRHQAVGARHIIGCRCMMKSLNFQIAVFIPTAGTYMQFVNQRIACLCQALAQQIGKKMVIAVPASFVIQRHKEQIGLFKRFQGFLSGNSRIVHNRITQGTAQTVEDSGAQKESLNRRRLLMQHFFHQIIQHKTMAAREVVDKGIQITACPILHGDGRHLQTGNPAFSTIFQCHDMRGQQV